MRVHGEHCAAVRRAGGVHLRRHAAVPLRRPLAEAAAHGGE